MKKDLREWKAGEIRENVSNNEAVYLELEGYAEIIKDETVTAPIEEIPAKRVPTVEVIKVEPEKEVAPEKLETTENLPDKKKRRRGRPRKTKIMMATSPSVYKTKGV